MTEAANRFWRAGAGIAKRPAGPARGGTDFVGAQRRENWGYRASLMRPDCRYDGYSLREIRVWLNGALAPIEHGIPTGQCLPPSDW